MIKTEIFYFVECDNCYKTIEDSDHFKFTSKTKEECIKMAKLHNWCIKRTRMFCPECIEEFNKRGVR